MRRLLIAAIVADRIGEERQGKIDKACPKCGATDTRVYRTMPWSGRKRTRYHRCAGCGKRFKSVEAMPTT